MMKQSKLQLTENKEKQKKTEALSSPLHIPLSHLRKGKENQASWHREEDQQQPAVPGRQRASKELRKENEGVGGRG